MKYEIGINSNCNCCDNAEDTLRAIKATVKYPGAFAPPLYLKGER
jgi:hypothetical protein